jgi:hypothetical protein
MLDLTTRNGDFDACDYVLRFRSGIALTDPDVDQDLVSEDSAELFYVPEDGPEEKRGAIGFILYRTSLATNLGEDILCCADACSQAAHDFAEVFLRGDNDEPWQRGYGSLVVYVNDWSDELSPLLLSLCLQRIDDFYCPRLFAVVKHPSLPRLEAFGFEVRADVGTEWFWRTEEFEHDRP